MKNWSQFYTPEQLSDLLISSIDKSFKPNHVIDICAGSCNLLYAAYKKWPKSKFHASDINKIRSSYPFKKNILFYKQNALKLQQLKNEFKRKSKKLILANPPFGILDSINDDLDDNYESFSNIIAGINRIECYIILSNIALLNKGDYFAAILPENIFTSQKSQSFRKFLIGCFQKVTIKKHNFKFPGSEVKTRLFIGKFNAFNETLFNFIDDGHSKIQGLFPLIRGVDNSILKKGIAYKGYVGVVHFNNVKGNIETNKRISGKTFNIDNKKISKKDILVFRVGRNAGTILVPDKRHLGFVPSDLLFILRNGKKLSATQLTGFQSGLKSKVKGLTSRYVAKRDIYETLEAVLSN